MNAFDYFFELTYCLDKPLLVGREEITYKDLYNSCINLSGWIRDKAASDSLKAGFPPTIRKPAWSALFNWNLSNKKFPGWSS